LPFSNDFFRYKNLFCIEQISDFRFQNLSRIGGNLSRIGGYLSRIGGNLLRYVEFKMILTPAFLTLTSIPSAPTFQNSTENNLLPVHYRSKQNSIFGYLFVYLIVMMFGKFFVQLFLS